MIDYSNGYKLCSFCKQYLPTAEFYSRKDNNGRLSSRCKKCSNKKSREYFRLHKNEMKERSQKWYIDNKEYAILSSKRNVSDNPQRTWCTRTIYTHKKAGFIIKFTRKELLNKVLTVSNCNICGKELNWKLDGTKGKGGTFNSPSLDRVNNESHMDLENIQIICNECNMTKQTRTMIEMLEYCKMFVRKFGDLK